MQPANQTAEIQNCDTANILSLLQLLMMFVFMLVQVFLQWVIQRWE